MDTFTKLLGVFKTAMPKVDTSTVTMETNLRNDLGMDSLNTMLVAILIEDEFGIRFDGSAQIETVGDVCRYVEQTCAGK